MVYEVEGATPRSRPKKTWKEILEWTVHRNNWDQCAMYGHYKICRYMF